MTLQVLDCTLRDGGYYNSWDFGIDLINDYLKAMSAISVDYVELGFRSLDTAGFKGGCAYTTDSFIKKLDIPSELKLGVMINASEILNHRKRQASTLSQLFKPSSKSPLTLVSIACHMHEKFDLICHFFVFEHIANPFEFLEKQLTMLNERGVIVAEIPSATDPLTSVYDIDAFEKFYWSIAHHYYYTPQSLKYVLDKMNLNYELIPEQRYDLSNHINWMMKGKPGGQSRFNHIFSNALVEKYMKDLKDHWLCDTIFLKIYKS